MRLIRCYIENFGKLEDFTYEFSDGLNVIQEENGWGKTTFGVFIKAMFYGLEYAPRRKTAENERRKYEPWQGGNFGGSLELEVKGRQYRIERYFGKRDKEDSFKLYDMKTGLLSSDYSERIGEEIFRIDVVSYERSTYIPQNGIGISMTDSINAKLSNLVENGNDINNYENAYARLEEHLKEYKKTGGRGKIAQLQEKLHTKQEEIEECKYKADGMHLKEEQIEEQLIQRRDLERKRKSLKAEILKASTQKEQAAKWQHYESLKKRVEATEKQKRPYDEIFRNGLPNETQLKDLEQQVELLTGLEQERALAHLNEEEEKQLEVLDNFFAAGCPEMPQIEMYLGESGESAKIKDEMIRLRTRLEMLDAQKEKEEQRRQSESTQQREAQHLQLEAIREKEENTKRWLLRLGILAGVFGMAFFLLPFPYWIGVIGIAAGVVLLLLSLLYKTKLPAQEETAFEPVQTEEQEHEAYRKEQEELESELAHLDAQEKEMKEHYRVFVEQFAIRDSEENPVQVLTEIKAKALEYQNLSAREAERGEQFKRLEEQITEVCFRLRCTFTAISPKYVEDENLRVGYEQLLTDRKQYLHLDEELAESRKELQDFIESNQGISFDTANQAEQTSVQPEELQTVSLEALQEQEKENEMQIEAINEKINSYRKDMDAMSVIVDMQTDFEEELEALQNEMTEAQYRCGILEKTMQYLKDAKEKFSTHYMGAMQKGFQKYAALMNSGENLDIRLDVQLDAQRAVGGAFKGSEYFSTGNRDFIGICIRLALIDALFEEEKPFIILDDPFVNLDDEKVKNAKQLLQEIGKEYQIIYLVCHSSRGGLGEKEAALSAKGA